MSRRLFLLCLAGLILVAPVSRCDAAETTGTTEFKTCVGASTIMSEKNVCYVIDLQTKGNKWVIELCAGVNFSGGTVILGGKASSMLCSTVEVRGAANREEAVRKAEEHLKKQLQEAGVQAALLKELGTKGPVKSVGPVTVKQDPQVGPKLKDEAAKAQKKHP